MKSWYVLREKVCYLYKKQSFLIIDIVKSETPLHQLIAYSGCNLFFLPKFGLIMAKEKHKTFLLSVAGQWVENFSKDLRSIFIFHLLLLLEIFWTLKIQAVLCLHGSLTTQFILVVTFVHLVLNHSFAYTVFCLQGCFSKVSKNSVSRGLAVLNNTRILIIPVHLFTVTFELMNCDHEKSNTQGSYLRKYVLYENFWFYSWTW